MKILHFFVLAFAISIFYYFSIYNPSGSEIENHFGEDEIFISPKAPTIDKTSKEEKLSRFLKWVVKEGADFRKNVSLEKIPGFGHGIIANEHLRKGEEYLHLPHSLLIGEDRLLSDRYFGHVVRSLRERYGSNIKYEIIFFLLYHKLVLGKRSPLQPFLDILPESFPNCPIFYSDEKMKLLRGSDLYFRIINRRENLRKQYTHFSERVFPHFPNHLPPHLITFEEWMWGHWIYSSRLFFIEGRSPREHLLPLADMINCHEPPQMEQSDDFEFVRDTGEYLTLKSHWEVQPGDQVFESYGFKSNAESLQYEGFILDDTPNDCVWVDLPYRNGAKEKFGYQQPPHFCLSAEKFRKYGNLPKEAVEYMRWYVEQEEGQRSMDMKEREGKMMLTLRDLARKKYNLNPYDPDIHDDKEHVAKRFMRFEKRQLKKLEHEFDRRFKYISNLK